MWTFLLLMNGCRHQREYRPHEQREESASPESSAPFHQVHLKMAEMANLVSAGQLKPHLDAVFPLKEVAQAHKLSEGGHVRGKVVLTVE
jgi:NADPH:quinone reductase-like Zn-dependent oxidoreductase